MVGIHGGGGAIRLRLGNVCWRHEVVDIRPRASPLVRTLSLTATFLFVGY